MHPHEPTRSHDNADECRLPKEQSPMSQTPLIHADLLDAAREKFGRKLER